MGSTRIGVGFGVMLLRADRILLGQRNVIPEKAESELHGEGTWTMPGGKLEFGETFENAAYREVEEETSIQLRKSNLKLISITNDIVHDAHFVTLGFLALEFSGKEFVCEPDEITQWGWFGLDELPSPLFFPSEKIIKNYSSGDIYSGD